MEKMVSILKCTKCGQGCVLDHELGMHIMISSRPEGPEDFAKHDFVAVWDGTEDEYRSLNKQASLMPM